MGEDFEKALVNPRNPLRRPLRNIRRRRFGSKASYRGDHVINIAPMADREPTCRSRFPTLC
jgi:hypothetical protein